MRKPAFCICENKEADQLRGNREADQRLCFRYTDSTIPLLPKSEISSRQPSSVVVQPSLCRTWMETLKTGFLRTRLKCTCIHHVNKPMYFRPLPTPSTNSVYRDIHYFILFLDTNMIVALGGSNEYPQYLL